jgi:hypothetical protein
MRQPPETQFAVNCSRGRIVSPVESDALAPAQKRTLHFEELGYETSSRPEL